MPSVSEASLLEKRAKLAELQAEKARLEGQIKELLDSLNQQGVGMHEPLVDREGFPRADVDVHGIRIARNTVIRLQNDHKALMTQVEKALLELHEEARQLKQQEGHGDAARPPPEAVRKAFARVGQVSAGSPAHSAGLQNGDEIVVMGSLSASNWRGNMDDLVAVVNNSAGQRLPLLVRRRGAEESLALTPQPWAGRGLLGCHIVPIA